jgi:hypothetical protein
MENGKNKDIENGRNGRRRSNYLTSDCRCFKKLGFIDDLMGLQLLSFLNLQIERTMETMMQPANRKNDGNNDVDINNDGNNDGVMDIENISDSNGNGKWKERGQ